MFWGSLISMPVCRLSFVLRAYQPSNNCTLPLLAAVASDQIASRYSMIHFVSTSLVVAVVVIAIPVVEAEVVIVMILEKM